MRWFKQQIDRWAIQTASKSLPRLPPDPAQASEVARLLQGPDPFIPLNNVPELTLHSDGRFQFASAIQTPFPRNNRVHGRIFRPRHREKAAPAVVLVHGWNAEMHYIHILPRVARELNTHGLTAILLELPYHLHRRPAHGESITNFISENIPRMLEATTQAIADINATLNWAKSDGARATATWGFSLGGWLAGLHLTVSAAQDAAVLATPVSNLERAVRELDFCHPIRSALAVAPADLQRLNLSNRPPKIPADRILLVEATHDQFVPSETYRDLAQAWGIQSWMKVPQSHITILFSRRASKEIIDWLAEKLPV